jgi:DNA mismatch endonuclease (patch repair protein)
MNVKGLPGSPDIAFPRLKKAILVHGCFWHVHPECAAEKLPGLGRNGDYWREKLARNVLRDRRDLEALTALGWAVLIIWECETENARVLRERLKAFLGAGPKRKRRPRVRRSHGRGKSSHEFGLATTRRPV